MAAKIRAVVELTSSWLCRLAGRRREPDRTASDQVDADQLAVMPCPGVEDDIGSKDCGSSAIVSAR